MPRRNGNAKPVKDRFLTRQRRKRLGSQRRARLARLGLNNDNGAAAAVIGSSLEGAARELAQPILSQLRLYQARGGALAPSF